MNESHLVKFQFQMISMVFQAGSWCADWKSKKPCATGVVHIIGVAMFYYGFQFFTHFWETVSFQGNRIHIPSPQIPGLLCFHGCTNVLARFRKAGQNRPGRAQFVEHTSYKPKASALIWEFPPADPDF